MYKQDRRVLETGVSILTIIFNTNVLEFSGLLLYKVITVVIGRVLSLRPDDQVWYEM